MSDERIQAYQQQTDLALAVASRADVDTLPEALELAIQTIEACAEYKSGQIPYVACVAICRRVLEVAS